MSGMPLLPLTWNTTYTNFQRSDPHKSWTHSFSSTGFILPFLWIQGAQSSLRSSKDVPDPWAAPVLHPSWSANASFDLHESPVSCSMKDPNLKPTSKKQTMYVNNDCMNSIYYMNLYTCTVPRKSSGWNVNSMIGWIQPALFQCSLHVPVLLCAGYMGPHWILGLAWHYMCTYASAQWGTCTTQKHDMIYDILRYHIFTPSTICTHMQYFPLFLDSQLLKGLLHDAVWLHDTLGTTGSAVTSRYFKRASLQTSPTPHPGGHAKNPQNRRGTRRPNSVPSWLSFWVTR